MDNLAHPLENAVNINGVTYIAEHENERVVLLRYNEKYSIWVKLRFSNEPEANSIKDYLSKQFIEAHI